MFETALSSLQSTVLNLNFKVAALQVQISSTFLNQAKNVKFELQYLKTARHKNMMAMHFRLFSRFWSNVKSLHQMPL